MLNFANLQAKMPPWTYEVLAFALAIVLALLVHHLLFRLAKRLTANRTLFWRTLVSRGENPMRLGIMLIALALAAQISRISGTPLAALSQIFFVGFIFMLGWFVHTALHISITVYSRRYSLESEDNLLARKHITQMRILQRVANFLIYLTTLSIALMTFDGVRQYGVSLLASAGAAGLIVGLALQPVIKNLIAGIQIAIAQPIRIDDALLIEGEWGNVEEITATYVVIRIWDWRRLVIPLSYFIEQPFQNWTKEGSALIGNVVIYLDFTAPIETIRTKAKRIVEDSKLWNKDVFALQVIDFTEKVMQVRILASAKNAAIAYDLRCEIREKLVDFIVKNHPDALPQTRAILDQPSEIVRDRAMGIKKA